MQDEHVTQNETHIEDFSLFEHITSWFDREGMNYESDQDRGYVETHIRSSAGRWAVVIEIDEYHEQLFFYSQLDIRALEERRQAVMEFMTRANNGMRLGHFELDLDEGDMCFKIGMQVGELAPSDVQIRNVIGSVVSIMTQYFHGLMAVLYAGRDPKEAIGSIENPVDLLEGSVLH